MRMSVLLPAYGPVRYRFRERLSRRDRPMEELDTCDGGSALPSALC